MPIQVLIDGSIKTGLSNRLPTRDDLANIDLILNLILFQQDVDAQNELANISYIWPFIEIRTVCHQTATATTDQFLFSKNFEPQLRVEITTRSRQHHASCRAASQSHNGTPLEL